MELSRDEIEEDIKEFLRNGGEITVVESPRIECAPRVIMDVPPWAGLVSKTEAEY